MRLQNQYSMGHNVHKWEDRSQNDSSFENVNPGFLYSSKPNNNNLKSVPILKARAI